MTPPTSRACRALVGNSSNTRTADPEVIKIDEKTKDVVSLPELVDAIGVGMLTPLSERINAPVLIVDGSHDPLVRSKGNCKDSPTLQASERPWYKASPCLQAHVVNGAAHDLNTAAEVDDYVAALRTWMDGHYGTPANTGACA